MNGANHPALAPLFQTGAERWENGEGRVVVQLGPIRTTYDPPTARAIAIALIHQAEIAGMEPPGPEDDEPEQKEHTSC